MVYADCNLFMLKERGIVQFLISNSYRERKTEVGSELFSIVGAYENMYRLGL